MFEISGEDFPGEIIAGIDEVGRGPLAGPVVACAVVIEDKIPGIKDSKKLTPKRRKELAKEIHEKAIGIGIGMSSEKLIDKINIKEATRRAMVAAVLNLQQAHVFPDRLLIDHETIDLEIPQESIVKGDNLVYEIACASIVAKEFRDDLMIKLSEDYPEYQWQNNKGYGTKVHRDAILDYGPTKYHRRSFLKKLLNKRS